MTDQFAYLGTTLFAIAVLHTFAIKWFQRLAQRHKEGSVLENLFHLLGEVEVVFGLWAGVLLGCLYLLKSGHETLYFLESLNFTEPLFVFVIMVMASTKPVLECTTFAIAALATRTKNLTRLPFYAATLTFGPLLGSFITEPASMTVTALILKDRFFDENVSSKFKYLTLATLFVNISISGLLTHFAAPPVLMVASIWSWDTPFMFDHFGWKAILAVLTNTGLATFVLRKELITLKPMNHMKMGCPAWVSIFHIFLLGLVVYNSHHPILFFGFFLFFLGFTAVTREFQYPLKLRESLLVAFFLAGLVILGTFQSWWLKPLLASLSAFPLFVGTTILTGFVDNAALTYLGAQVSGLTEEMKYALVAGACTGGGLTVIANAPNPAGFSILGSSFGKEGISPIKLFLVATLPTLIAAVFFWGL